MVTKVKKKSDNNKNKSKYKKSRNTTTNVLFNFCKPDWYKLMFHYHFITSIFASLTTSEFEHFCFHVYRTGTPALLRKISLCTLPVFLLCCLLSVCKSTLHSRCEPFVISATNICQICHLSFD